MSPESILAIAKTVIDGVVQMITLLGGDPRGVIVQILDANPLVSEADRAADKALQDKFGDGRL